MLIFAIIGAITGLFAGLLGLGGGSLFVPLLIVAFHFLNFPHEVSIHMAIATSMAAMILMEATATLVHVSHCTIYWKIVLIFAPSIMIGSFLGAKVAEYTNGNWLLAIIICFQLYIATHTVLHLKQEDHPGASSNRVPQNLWSLPVALGIGMLSSLLGIGGGKLLVPYFCWCKLPVRVAISTAPPIGFLLGLSATAGYIFADHPIVGKIPGPHWGFVYLPALGGILSTSILSTLLGARLVHGIPPKLLKIILAFMFYVLAIQMIFDLF